MSKETIELYKPWNPSKMQWPAIGSEKLDGVPIRLSHKAALTRQGEEVPASVQHIQRFFSDHFSFAPGVELVGELYIRGTPFKEISGLVRQQQRTAHDLKLYVFDLFANYDEARYREAPYGKRIDIAKITLEDIAGKLGSRPEDLPIQIIPYTLVDDEEGAVALHEQIMFANPDAEGTVFHSYDKAFQPGTRKWLTQKLKPEPTVDIEIVGFNEAIGEDGTPLGMVGRLVGTFHRVGTDGATAPVQIGIGPGKLTHDQRRALWQVYTAGYWGKAKTRVAEVKYMRDDSYDALRQPTFQRWRTDKGIHDVDVIG